MPPLFRPYFDAHPVAVALHFTPKAYPEGSASFWLRVGTKIPSAFHYLIKSSLTRVYVSHILKKCKRYRHDTRITFQLNAGKTIVNLPLAISPSRYETGDTRSGSLSVFVARTSS